MYASVLAGKFDQFGGRSLVGENTADLSLSPFGSWTTAPGTNAGLGARVAPRPQSKTKHPKF